MELANIDLSNFITIWDSIAGEDKSITPYYDKLALTDKNNEWWFIPVDVDFIYSNSIIRIYKTPRRPIEFHQLHVSGLYDYNRASTELCSDANLILEAQKRCEAAAYEYSQLFQFLSSDIKLLSDEENMLLLKFGHMGLKALLEDLFNGN